MSGSFPHTEKLEWRTLVVPSSLRREPIHRWFVFPHSFTHELVIELAKEWSLTPDDRILDPFVGAGTTVVTAKALRIPAHGLDLSPLAAFVTNVKVGSYQEETIRDAFRIVLARARGADTEGEPDLIRRAFKADVLSHLCGLRDEINKIGDDAVRRFLLLGLIGVISGFSSIRADGGWLREGLDALPCSEIHDSFGRQVETMISDLVMQAPAYSDDWGASIADARCMPPGEPISAVITSPPYPNRHDYSRVFSLELQFAFTDSHQTRSLRHASFRSHPEARPVLDAAPSYKPPGRLTALVQEFTNRGPDGRLPRMLNGYFEDLHLVLVRLASRLADNSRIAFVVGNVRYLGIEFPVDELLAELASVVGYDVLELRAVRYRGNSAQQMKRYGRVRCRESCVILRHSGSISQPRPVRAAAGEPQ